MHTGEKVFSLQLLWRFVIRFLLDKVKKLVEYFGLHESFLNFQRREDQMEQSIQEWIK